MNEMKRLLDDAIAPEIAELLRSAELDEPSAPEERRARILAAIAAAPAVSVLAPATTAALPAAWSRLAKLLRVGAWSVPFIGVVAGAIALSSASRSAPPAEPSTAAETRPTTAGTEPAVRAHAESHAPAVRVEDLPTAAPSTSIAPRLVAKKSADAPRAAPDIGDEIAAIDAARAALASGRPDEALAGVQRYRSTFVALRFADEADALEIQALSALGRSDDARRKAERFLAAHPASPYARRVRAAAGLDR